MGGDLEHLQKFWENRNSFLRKYILPAAKRMRAELLVFVLPNIADIVTGRKFCQATAKSVGRQFVREQLVARRRVQAKSIQQNLQNEAVGREEAFLQTFLINHVE